MSRTRQMFEAIRYQDLLEKERRFERDEFIMILYYRNRNLINKKT